MRIGIGYDAHKLAEGRKLILAGVEIPFEKGLLGHSDADVLTHAVIDALLGALKLGDIGRLFPDNDTQYKGISSLELLKKVHEIITQKGYEIGNIDSTIIAQAPKLAQYISQMEQKIADTIEICPKIVSIKATTEEKMGFTGAGEGISAQAIVLLKKTRFDDEII